MASGGSSRWELGSRRMPLVRLRVEYVADWEAKLLTAVVWAVTAVLLGGMVAASAAKFVYDESADEVLFAGTTW